MSSSDHGAEDSWVPFVDVLFALLVVVLSMSAAEVGEVPPPPHPKPGPAGTHGCMVDVLPDGRLRLNREPKTADEIVREWKANRPASVLIRAHEDAPIKYVRGVRKLCAAAGIDPNKVPESARTDRPIAGGQKP